MFSDVTGYGLLDDRISSLAQSASIVISVPFPSPFPQDQNIFLIPILPFCIPFVSLSPFSHITFVSLLNVCFTTASVTILAAVVWPVLVSIAVHL